MRGRDLLLFGMCTLIWGSTWFDNIVAVRNHCANLPTMPATAWGTLSAALAAIILGVPMEFDARPAYVLSLFYLAVFGSVVAFGAYLTLLKNVGAGPRRSSRYRRPCWRCCCRRWPRVTGGRCRRSPVWRWPLPAMC